MLLAPYEMLRPRLCPLDAERITVISGVGLSHEQDIERELDESVWFGWAKLQGRQPDKSLPRDFGRGILEVR